MRKVAMIVVLTLALVEVRALQLLPIESADLAITGVAVVDVQNGRAVPDQTVIVRGNRIIRMGSSQTTRPLRGATVVDGRRKFLIPALWDMHVHLLYPERLASVLPLLVVNGVLGIRDMGSTLPAADLRQLRADIAAGTRVGPTHIIDAGPILDGQKKPAPFAAFFVQVTTAEEGKLAADKVIADGFDFVKVYSWLTRDAYFAIAEEAKRRGTSFAGHVPMAVTAQEASSAGQKSMEHLFGIPLEASDNETRIRAELVHGGTSVSAGERMAKEVDEALESYSSVKAATVFNTLAKNRTWQIATFRINFPPSVGYDAAVTGSPLLKYVPESVRTNWARTAASVTPEITAIRRRTFERQLQLAKALYDAGVPMLAGTDTGWYAAYTGYAGFTLHDELALLVRAGLTPAQALKLGTNAPAEYANVTTDAGSIEPGKVADLVLLTASPLDDIHNTQKIEAVVANGRLFTRVQLDALLTTAAAAVSTR